MAERHLSAERRMSAPVSAVWALFADFPNLADHWGGLRSTSGIGEPTSGLGARRQVGLKPMGSMEETVTAWEEGRRIDTRNVPSAAVPFSEARSSLVLEASGDGTLARFDYWYVPRGGALGRLTGPLIDRMLTATFADMLAAVDEQTRSQG